jgi:hypothetical protein
VPGKQWFFLRMFVHFRTGIFFKSAVMKSSSLISSLLIWVTAFVYGQQQWPLHNDGYNSVVEW